MPRANGILHALQLRDDGRGGRARRGRLGEIAQALGVDPKVVERPGAERRRRLQRMIDQAGLPMKSGALILGTLSLTGLVWLLGSSFLKMPYVVLVAALVAGSIPLLWVMRKRRQRIDRFEELLCPAQLPVPVNELP